MSPACVFPTLLLRARATLWILRCSITVPLPGTSTYLSISGSAAFNLVRCSCVEGVGLCPWSQRGMDGALISVLESNLVVGGTCRGWATVELTLARNQAAGRKQPQNCCIDSCVSSTSPPPVWPISQIFSLPSSGVCVVSLWPLEVK